MTAGFRVLSSGAVLTGLVLAYSGSHLVIGLLGALPLLAKAAQILAPRLINWFGASRVTRVAGWLERAAFVVAAVAGLARVPGAVAWMLAGLGVGTIGGAIYDVGLTAISTRLVAPREQGRFYAIRTRWLSAFSVIAAVLGGLLVDFAERHGVIPTTARGVTLLAGLLPAGLAMVALRRFDRTAALPVRAARPEARIVAEPLGIRATGEFDSQPTKRDPVLRAILVFAAAWGFSTGITARHIEVFALTEVGFSLGTLTVMTGLIAGAGFIGARTWGRLGDHFGAKPILLVAVTVVAINPLWYAMATEAHPAPFVVGQVLGGIANAGWLIGVPLLLLRTPMQQGSNVRALALFHATVGVSSSIAPLIGGALLDALSALGRHTSYVVLFGVTAVLRLASVRLLAMVPDSSGGRMGRMAHVFWRAQTRYAASRIAAAYRGSTVRVRELKRSA